MHFKLFWSKAVCITLPLIGLYTFIFAVWQINLQFVLVSVGSNYVDRYVHHCAFNPLLPGGADWELFIPCQLLLWSTLKSRYTLHTNSIPIVIVHIPMSTFGSYMSNAYKLFWCFLGTLNRVVYLLLSVLSGQLVSW